jgi:menaquinone-dependent protoporphyrinogen oxidase
MMEVLVSAASKYGATTEIAKAIDAVLAERGFDTTMAPPEQVVAIENYGAVVLGSAVYMGQWMKPARALVDRSCEVLAALPVWLFSSGPVGEPPKPPEDSVDVAGDPRGDQGSGPSGVRREDGQEAAEFR